MCEDGGLRRNETSIRIVIYERMKGSYFHAYRWKNNLKSISKTSFIRILIKPIIFLIKIKEFFLKKW